ncbi:hypothetical protein AP9108_34060 [Arthrospira sp. PCC 9108]|nr:hypothetical protein AP9108_34060 [Arthrospira sp. PCC 9108]
MSAAYQPVSLPNHYDGSSRTFGSLIMDGCSGLDSGWVTPWSLPFPASILGCDSQNWGAIAVTLTL